MNIKNIFASAGLVTLVTIATMSYQVKAAGTTRISGENRYETAANVASTNWTSSSCKNAIIVSGESYADAVSASVLAKTLNAPILFTESESLDSNTQNALEKLKPENIYIIGGTGVVSQSVQNLLSDYNVTRLSGENRYSTNLAVADKLVELGVKANKVLVVGGQGFSDALSTAPIASAKNEILLLADNNENDMEGTAEFVSKNNSDVMVIGTENMVNSKIYNKLNASNRLDGGKDRFETNLKILDYYKDNLKNNKMYVADIAGNSYADALVATALSGKYSAPLVFTGTEGETGTINAIFYINSNADKYSTSINVVGGTGILPNSIVNSISPSSSKSSDNDHDSSSSHSSSSGSSSSSTSQQAIAVATTAVEKSESSKLQSDVDSAKALVDALEDSTDKTSLLTRLQKVQQEIDEAKEQQVLSDATTAVEKAESSKVQADVDCAKILVNALVDSKDKTDLLNRLQVVQEYINTQNDNNDGSSSDDSSSNSQQALDNATSAVEKAESSKTQSDVDSAKTLVKALVDGTDKTNLLNRLAVVQKAIDDKTAQDAENAAYQKELQDATNAVAKAENSKLQADIDSAKTLVNALVDGKDKTDLLTRLQVVQKTIDDKDSEDQVITTHEGFYNALENAFENCDTMLDIYTDSEDMSKYNPVTTINELEINRPDLAAEYLGTNNNTATKISDNKYEFKLNFEFGDTTEVLLQKREVSQNKVSQIIESVITADMTDYDKELALHDYLVNNCEYDPTVIAGDIPDGRDDDYTAYGALINEKAVCQGYADAMYRLLKAVGIKSIMVSGTATNGVNTEAHAWNIVTIGGQTYQFDATFDDPSYKDGRNNPTHDYFNITDSQLSKDHTWDTSEYPACNSTDYSYKN